MFTDNELAAPLVITVTVFVLVAPGPALTTTNRFCNVVSRVEGVRVIATLSVVGRELCELFGGK